MFRDVRTVSGQDLLDVDAIAGQDLLRDIDVVSGQGLTALVPIKAKRKNLPSFAAHQGSTASQL